MRLFMWPERVRQLILFITFYDVYWLSAGPWNFRLLIKISLQSPQDVSTGLTNMLQCITWQ